MGKIKVSRTKVVPAFMPGNAKYWGKKLNPLTSQQTAQQRPEQCWGKQPGFGSPSFLASH